MARILDVYSQLYALELAMVECATLHAEGNPIHYTPKRNMAVFNSSNVTKAFNYVQLARMNAGSIARMFDMVIPYKNSFIGKAEQEDSEVLDNVTMLADYDNLVVEDGELEIGILSVIRCTLAEHPNKKGMYYELLSSYTGYLNAAKANEKVNELDVRLKTEALLCNIDNACNMLGLRFGEIVGK